MKDNIHLIIPFILLIIVVVLAFFDVVYKRKEKESKLKEDINKLIKDFEESKND